MTDDADIVEVSLDDILRRVERATRETATPEEATAVAVAIGAHLTDRARAADSDGDETATVDPWAFAGRLSSVGQRPRGRPRAVARGDEWRVAARRH